MGDMIHLRFTRLKASDDGYSFKSTIWHALLPVILYFGSTNSTIQNLIVHLIPTIIFATSAIIISSLLAGKYWILVSSMLVLAFVLLKLPNILRNFYDMHVRQHTTANNQRIAPSTGTNCDDRQSTIYTFDSLFENDTSDYSDDSDFDEPYPESSDNFDKFLSKLDTIKTQTARHEFVRKQSIDLRQQLRKQNLQRRLASRRTYGRIKTLADLPQGNVPKMPIEDDEDTGDAGDAKAATATEARYAALKVTRAATSAFNDLEIALKSSKESIKQRLLVRLSDRTEASKLIASSSEDENSSNDNNASGGNNSEDESDPDTIVSTEEVVKKTLTHSHVIQKRNSSRNGKRKALRHKKSTKR